jgi:hypothetical protein
MATQPGSRVSSMKHQAGHGFARGQPVVFSGGIYRLATTSTGFNGVCGTIPDTNRFEVVTGGELDGLDGLTPETTLYLTATAGVLGTSGTIAVFRANTVATAWISAPQVAGSTVADTSAAGIAAAIAAHVAEANPHPQYLQLADITEAVNTAVAGLPADSRYVRTTPAAILDTDIGELVWDVELQTQVLDPLYT